MKQITKTLFASVLFLTLAFVFAPAEQAAAQFRCPDGSYVPIEQADQCPPDPTGPPGVQQVEFATQEGQHQCGAPRDEAVMTSLDFGCKGEEIELSGGRINPILDMAFALFRIASAGVGLVIIGSIIWAGIQYSASRGNPQMTEAAIKRVTNSVIALLLYIFIFAIANFLVPGGLFIWG